MAGLFEVLVTFNQDVYSAAGADAQENEDFSGGLKHKQFYRLQPTQSALERRCLMGKCYSLARVDTDADTTGIQGHKRQFIAEVTVNEAAAQAAPLAIRLALNADAGLYSKATAAGFVDGEIVEAADGLNNQGSSGDFTVTGKAPLNLQLVAQRVLSEVTIRLR